MKFLVILQVLIMLSTGPQWIIGVSFEDTRYNYNSVLLSYLSLVERKEI